MKELNAAYFAASCDPVKKNTEFAKSLKLDYPILSDPDGKTAKAYGIYSKRGFSSRVTFYIDSDGKISHIEKKVNVRDHGKQIVETLAKLKEEQAKAEKRKKKEAKDEVKAAT